MKTALFLKSVSLLMIAMVFTVSVTGFCHDAGAADHDAGTRQKVNSCTTDEKGCPSCPVDEHSVPGHCDSSCHCSCFAPLKAETVQVGCSPPASRLTFYEPYQSFPEVYPSRFIPPQILA